MLILVDSKIPVDIFLWGTSINISKWGVHPLVSPFLLNWIEETYPAPRRRHLIGLEWQQLWKAQKEGCFSFLLSGRGFHHLKEPGCRSDLTEAMLPGTYTALFKPSVFLSAGVAPSKRDLQHSIREHCMINSQDFSALWTAEGNWPYGYSDMYWDLLGGSSSEEAN